MKSSTSYSANAPAATIALLSFAYFVIAVVALYFLNPSYSLTNSIVGNYHLGSNELLIASTFFALGIGSLALVPGLFRVVSPSVQAWIGLLLLGVWGLGILMAGIFPANEGGSTVPHRTTVLLAGIFPVEVEAYPETQFSFLHLFTILGSFLSLAIASTLLSWKFKQSERSHTFRSISRILALLMLALAVLFIPTFLYPSLLGYTTFNAGFFVLIGVQIGILWLILTAAWLRFVTHGSVATR
jgi:hypothetical protein